jgi:ribonuclease G
MTLIDVDGDDAMAGARAAGQAIRRYGISGNIGIDLPTVAGRAERQAIAEAFDASLPQPYERTAVNGFGFLQVIRPRVRASLCEIVQYDRAGASARALIRGVQRSGSIGPSEISASAKVIAAIECNPDWTEQLSRDRGGPVLLRSES